MAADGDSSINCKNKKARLENSNHQSVKQPEESLSFGEFLDGRYGKIRQWIARPIDESRDEDGVFRDPFPASVVVKVKKPPSKETKKDLLGDPASNSHVNSGNNSGGIAVLEDTGVLIGNKYHASDVDNLVELGVTAVLNCASGGISRLPMDELREKGIRYGFTNVRQDDLKYPILHELTGDDDDKNNNPIRQRQQQREEGEAETQSRSNSTSKDKSSTGDENHEASQQPCYLPTLAASQHLKIAKAMYIEEVLQRKGKLMFFCVAGQNRSATLALAALLLRGDPHYTMDAFCESLAETRPFVLENEGFQKQLLELEWYLKHQCDQRKRSYATSDATDTPMVAVYAHGDQDSEQKSSVTKINSKGFNTGLESKNSNNEDTNNFSDSSMPKSQQSVQSSILTINPGHPIDKRERVEIELLIPGLCTMEAFVPVPSSIREVKRFLIDHVNTHLLKGEDREIAKGWIVLAVFGKDNDYDLPLEDEVIEPSIQWERLSAMFHLKTEESKDENGAKTRLVHWNSSCRFALVIFSVFCNREQDPQNPDQQRLQLPWTFVHRERRGAPATLLNNTLAQTHLRAWDFCDGQAFTSMEPIVFSYSNDPREKRQFMRISTSAQESQQFHAPGEGGILGMGSNAIVHRVELRSTSPRSLDIDKNKNNDGHDSSPTTATNESGRERWNAAVKRPFSLSKMLASLKTGSEAGLGKRLRQLSQRSLLNSSGRVLYVYGLGVALSSNAERPTEYKMEATILARYEEEFSTYTMKRFMMDYTSQSKLAVSIGGDDGEDDWRNDFSLISVKILLVSLLNAFRDLTLMGVRAFDFNHLGNVLVSRDHQHVKLLDIDGDSRGSIPLSEYQDQTLQTSSSSNSLSRLLPRRSSRVLYKPSLDVDLNAVLPTVVQQLLLGKKRGTAFVANTKSTIWRLPPDEAKVLVEQTIIENFGPLTESHSAKIVEWFYAMLKKQPPWGNWTKDIYDAMRCIDHLPVR